MPLPVRIKPVYLRIAAVIAGIIGIVVLILGSVAYNKREKLLTSAIDKAKAKAKSAYNLDVKIDSAHFIGLNKVGFGRITVVPDGRDTLLDIGHLRIAVKMMPLIVGDVKLEEVELADAFLQVVNKKGKRNFDFLFNRQKNDDEPKGKADLSVFANNLINQFLYKIPDNLDLKNFNIRYLDDENAQNLYVKSALIDDGKLSSTIIVNRNEATWHATGELQPSDNEINVRLFADHKKLELPIIEKLLGLKINADTLGTELKKVSHSSGKTTIEGSWYVRNLLMNQPRIASNDIVVPDAALDAVMIIGENYVSLDSASSIHLKKLEAHPFIKYTLSPNKIYELKMSTEWQDAQAMFDAFPAGLFESLEGTKVSGKLKYGLNLYLDSSLPDSVRFNSYLDQQNFRILQFGKTDMRMLNQPFVYTPYEDGKPMPSRKVGPENPNFTPINSISPNLRYAVMAAEDPSFFNHHGFVMKAFQNSIADNYKKRRFARGGSTISMQLVKNAFLSREKTIARKIEEILIVWMIENTNVTTKSRMYEVYLNIIEWGRNVYGIGEAARYYFNKRPEDLSIGESIYLASIVPSPKKGLYAFNGDGSLRSYLHGYFRLLGNSMARRGWTPPDSSAYGFYNVRLKESLRTGTPVDTMMTDSNDLLIDSLDMDDGGQVGGIKGFFQRMLNGERDTAKTAAPQPDSSKSPADERRERREQRRRERQERRDRGY
ncbi:MAG: transglycosylase domain-containing protein [Mucilaginibacter polytrichastri]|nr:transglycosylase domain-containing protein [Mucilaginibacter polytrichastri]